MHKCELQLRNQRTGQPIIRLVGSDFRPLLDEAFKLYGRQESLMIGRGASEIPDAIECRFVQDGQIISNNGGQQIMSNYINRYKN